MSFKKLLTEPLVQFLGLGALLFVVAGVMGKTGTGEADRRIVVTEGQVVRLMEGWSRTWQRPPTRRELDGLIDDYVKEEIMYREAIAMGLDRDDAIIRRRLRQKMEFLSEDIAASITPTDVELQAYLDENPDKFRTPPRYSFTHVYFSVDRRKDAAQSDATNAVTAMNRQGGVEAAEGQGDPFPLPATFGDMSERDVAGLFGQEFAAALAPLEPDTWHGAVASGYGWHAVYISERVDGRIPEFREIRDVVQRELMFARRQEMSQGIYAQFRDRYDVSIEMPENLAADSSPAQ